MDRYWDRQKLQNRLADIRAFRILEALYALGGAKGRLSPGEVFPLLAGMESAGATEETEGLYGADSPDFDSGERAWVQMMKEVIR